MIPSLATYDNLSLLTLIDVNIDKYNKQLDDIYKEKKQLFKISLILILPIIFVLSFFSLFHFQTAWWSFFVYLFVTSFISFLIITLPVYQSLSETCLNQEKDLFQEVDKHLTELANQGYFSKDAKSKRLLNQEFELVKLQVVKPQHLNAILGNEKLTAESITFINKNRPDDYVKKTVFFEARPLVPVVLATINFLDAEKKFGVQTIIPIEFELVRGLVSEQITYLDKEGYFINPMIYIDADHFQEIFESES